MRKQVLTHYREFVESAPEKLNVWVVLRKAPPLPFLPEEVHGKEVVVLIPFYVGDAVQGRKLIEPLLRFGAPHGGHIGAQPYTQWLKAFDPRRQNLNDLAFARGRSQIAGRFKRGKIGRPCDAVAAGCGRQCGDQPGWTTPYDHKVVVAPGRILSVRRVALVDRALIVFIRW